MIIYLTATSTLFLVLISLIVFTDESSPQQSINLDPIISESYDQTERKQFKTPLKARMGYYEHKD